MTFSGVLGCGKFRQALKREPLDTQNKLIAIKQRIEMKAYKQAYYLLEATEAERDTKARLYEQIGRNEDGLKNESLRKAVILYNEAGQKGRADYLLKMYNIPQLSS